MVFVWTKIGFRREKEGPTQIEQITANFHSSIEAFSTCEKLCAFDEKLLVIRKEGGGRWKGREEEWKIFCTQFVWQLICELFIQFERLQLNIQSSLFAHERTIEFTKHHPEILKSIFHVLPACIAVMSVCNQANRVMFVHVRVREIFVSCDFVSSSSEKCWMLNFHI